MAAQTHTLEATKTEYVTFMAGGNKGSRPILRGKDMKPTFDKIPLIDFTNINSVNMSERRKLALEVRAAFTNVGFVYASNHGISKALQKEVFQITKEFFALPLEEKMKNRVNKSTVIGGYEAMFETKSDPKNRGDLKEAFNISEEPDEIEQEASTNLNRTQYPTGPMTHWPSQPADFRAVLSQYRQACFKFSRQFLKIIALSLDLDENYFSKLNSFPMAGLRPLHYPSQEISTDVGQGAHTDYSWFTLVNQLSPVQALEVLNHNAHWVQATPIANTLVINVGDFLEQATNGLFQSTVHRVINRTGQERYSIPFFYNPNHGTLVEVIPTCITKERLSQYEPVKVGKWY